ncbi:MAG: TetR/AcrR family transcriptional regulator [Clostridia bacterium]|nr:TetR/AcrR family transcriptional regulator [Clostridia bacterium]
MNKSESKYFNTAVKMDKALLEILEKKDFEYITVKELCEKAGVNRSTFYLHYQNTRDLLDETVRYILDGFLTYFPDETSLVTNGFAECTPDEMFFISEKYVYPFLRYFRDNKRIFKTMVMNSVPFGLEGIYDRLFKNVFNPVLARFNYPEKDRNYVMVFYLTGICAVIMKWIEEDCEKSDEEIATVIGTCILGRNGELGKMLERFE